MGFRLLPNKVYATKQTNLGNVIFQPVGGNIQLYGSNITRYSNENGNKKIIIPKFEELIQIWDDEMIENTVNPMNCLTSWIGFTSNNENTEVWVNAGINENITPTFDVNIGQ